MSKNKIKFLHIFGPDTKNSYGIMRQLHKYCNLDEHKYLIAAYDECKERFPKLNEFPDLIFVPHDCSRFKRIVFFVKLLMSAENIIWHSLFFTTKKYLYFLYVFRHFLKKSTWIEWGADLYNWEYENPNRKQKILNHIGRKVRKGFANVGCIFPSDREEYIKQYGNKARTFYTPMCNPLYEADGLMKFIDSQKVDVSNEEVQVQVAHNSFSFNNHVKLLNYLEKYRDEKIHLFLPIAYGKAGINGRFGGNIYLNAIEKYADEMWGDKIDILTQGIPFEKYISMLWKIDIAVFDFDRPCGLGTIRILLYMGKKIFIPSGNPFYDFFIKNGIKVYDTNQIPNMSFEEFCEPVTETDLSWIKGYLNNETNTKFWLEMFEEISFDRKLNMPQKGDAL